MKKLQRKRKGFTLIELVVVIVIIAILAAVALLRFGNFTETAKNSRIKQEHSQLITAGNMWRAAQEHPETAPTDIDDLKAYMEKPVLEDGVHTLDAEGVLTSRLYVEGTLAADTDAANILTYNFAAVEYNDD